MTRNNNKTLQTIEGLLLKKQLHIGSKSEHIGFVLVVDITSIIIYKNGDNPFMHESLQSLENKVIRATGQFYNNKFIADDIEIVK